MIKSIMKESFRVLKGTNLRMGTEIGKLLNHKKRNLFGKRGIGFERFDVLQITPKFYK